MLTMLSYWWCMLCIWCAMCSCENAEETTIKTPRIVNHRKTVEEYETYVKNPQKTRIPWASLNDSLGSHLYPPEAILYRCPTDLAMIIGLKCSPVVENITLEVLQHIMSKRTHDIKKVETFNHTKCNCVNNT
nr:uncharacterized protein LOC111418041 [Onthophagus taurus]